ncbi:hypothetical protein A2U01_0078859, partial [Trifolium medium]|nr:hypothetical protein [Trifolium medium]
MSLGDRGRPALAIRRQLSPVTGRVSISQSLPVAR